MQMVELASFPSVKVQNIALDLIRNYKIMNEVAEKNDLDMIITDINMPNMDGITLTAKLRELESYTFTPILILTTETSEPRKNEAKKAGATGWIEKPFDPDHLLSTINKVM